MKKLASAIAAAAALTAVSGAHAAWDNGSVNAFDGNGELLLVVFDQNAAHKVSVAQDLSGADFNTFEAGVSSFSVGLNSSAFSVFSTSNLADLRWAVIALDNNAFNPAPRVQTTTNLAAPALTAERIGAINNFAAVLPTSVNGSDTNLAADNATVGTVGAGNYLGDDALFGRYLNLVVDFDTTAGIGESLAYWSFTGDDLTAPVKLGQWSINLGTGTLSYSSSAPEVPVPAAAWLMGSALLGLGSVARRRRA